MKSSNDKIVNYVELKENFSLFHRTFAYLDTEDYLADSIFSRKNINVKFKNMECRRGSLVIVVCKVKKKDIPDFISSMNELSRNIMLLTHNSQEYADVCNNLFERFTIQYV